MSTYDESPAPGVGRVRDDNVYGYPPPVWQRFARVRHAGRFAAGEPGVAQGRAGSPATRAVLVLAARVEDGRVREARFQAYGCPVTIAVGEWLAEWLTGRGVAEIGRLNAAELRTALEIPDDKAHCALMGEDALQALSKTLVGT